MFTIALATLVLANAGGPGYVFSAGSGYGGGRPNQNVYDRAGMVEGLGVVKGVSSGTNFNLAVKADGSVWGWGQNDNRQLGQGQKRGYFDTVVPIPNLPEIKSVAAGSNHSLALSTAGEVWGWGNSRSGQLGPAAWIGLIGSPLKVTGIANITQIDAGGSYSVALQRNGKVWTWGWNYFGQLGDGTTVEQRSSPQIVPGLTKVVQVAAGRLQCFALKDDGTVWAWGYNSNGRLGVGSTDLFVRSPMQVVDLTLVQKVAAGDGFALALRDTGQVYAWGDNDLGQLGFSTPAGGTGTPTLISDLSGITDIGAGQNRSIAMDADGNVFGSGYVDDLVEDSLVSPTFIQAENLPPVESIEGGGNYSLFIAKMARPLWTSVNPQYVVSGRQDGKLRIHTEKIFNRPVTVDLWTESEDIELPASAVIPPGADHVDVTLVGKHRVVNWKTARIWANADEFSVASEFSLAPETVGFVFPDSTPFAGETVRIGIRTNFAVPEGGMTFDLSADPASQVVMPSTVTIPAGLTGSTFDATFSGATTGYFVGLTATSGPLSGSNDIYLKGHPVATATFSPPTTIGGAEVKFTINLVNPAPAGGLKLFLAESNYFETLPKAVNFAAGQSSKTVKIVAKPVRYGLGIGVGMYTDLANVRYAYLNVQPPAIASFLANPSETQGGQTVHLTLSLDGPTVGGNISLTSNNPAVQVPSSVAIGAGQSTVEFDVPTSAVVARTVVTVKAKLHGASATTKITLTP